MSSSYRESMCMAVFVFDISLRSEIQQEDEHHHDQDDGWDPGVHDPARTQSNTCLRTDLRIRGIKKTALRSAKPKVELNFKRGQVGEACWMKAVAMITPAPKYRAKR